MVIRVDALDARAGIGRGEDPGEPGPGRDAKRVDQRRTLAVARSLVAVDVLEERASGERVDRLEPAADAEDGDAARLRDGPCLVFERIAIELDGDRPSVGTAVALRMEVGAAADEESVHRGERFIPGGRLGRRVEDDRFAAVALDRGHVQGVAAGSELGLRLPIRDSDGDHDPRCRGGRSAHRVTIAPRPRDDARSPGRSVSVARRRLGGRIRRCSAPGWGAASAGSPGRLPCAGSRRASSRP